MTCFVRHCKNIKRFCIDENISFHVFPADRKMRQQWLRAIKRTELDFVQSKYRKICSAHFTPNNFIISSGRRRVKNGAIPSLDYLYFDKGALKRTNSDMETNDEGRTTINDFEDSANRPKKLKLDPGYKSVEIGDLRRMKYLRKKRLATIKKIVSFKTLLTILRNKRLLSTNAIDHLSKTIRYIPDNVFNEIDEIFKRIIQYGDFFPISYKDELKAFAVALLFYSNKAYNYVRKYLNVALPPPKTVRKWGNVDCCNPGYLRLAFEALEEKIVDAEALGRKLIFNLIVDETPVKKRIDLNGKRTWGYKNIGFDIDTDEIEPAQKALILMVVCMNSSWKLIIAYFLIDTLSSEELSNVVRETLIKLSDIKATVAAVSCPESPQHFAMFKRLGCDFENPDEPKVGFQRAIKRTVFDSTKNVYAIFDASRLQRKLGFALALEGAFFDPEGDPIKWDYIFELDLLKTILTNKLRYRNIELKRRVMRVDISEQPLSEYVEKSLILLTADQNRNQFHGASATIKFIQKINKLVNVLNSRLPCTNEPKGLLKVIGEDEFRTFLHDTVRYLLNLRDAGGTFLWQTKVKTSIIGFVVTIKSVLGIYDEYLKTNVLKYLLTYKLGLDHMQQFLSTIRSQNGDENPTCLELMLFLKKVLLRSYSDGIDRCKVLEARSSDIFKLIL